MFLLEKIISMEIKNKEDLSKYSSIEKRSYGKSEG